MRWKFFDRKFSTVNKTCGRLFEIFFVSFNMFFISFNMFFYESNSISLLDLNGTSLFLDRDFLWLSFAIKKINCKKNRIANTISNLGTTVGWSSHEFSCESVLSFCKHVSSKYENSLSKSWGYKMRIYFTTRFFDCFSILNCVNNRNFNRVLWHFIKHS